MTIEQIKQAFTDGKQVWILGIRMMIEKVTRYRVVLNCAPGYGHLVFSPPEATALLSTNPMVAIPKVGRQFLKPIPEILKEMLILNGFDGLSNGEIQCGCGVNDLAPCGSYMGDCYPAKKFICDRENCENGECDGETGCDCYIIDNIEPEEK